MYFEKELRVRNRRNRSKSGFTLIELLIVVVILVIVIGYLALYLGLICGIAMGNYWVSDEGALKAVQVDNPEVTEVVKIQRNIWDYSVVTVKNEFGKNVEFLLDTDVLWNCDVIVPNTE